MKNVKSAMPPVIKSVLLYFVAARRGPENEIHLYLFELANSPAYEVRLLQLARSGGE